MDKVLVEKIVDEVVEGWSEGDHPRDKDGKFAPSEGRDSKGRSQKNRDAEDKLRNAGFNIKGKIRLGKDEQGPNSAQGHSDKRSTEQIQNDIVARWDWEHPALGAAKYGNKLAGIKKPSVSDEEKARLRKEYSRMEKKGKRKK